MTPKQMRAELMRRWQAVEEDLMSLNRRKAEMDLDEYNRQRVLLINTRESLEQALGELYLDEVDPNS